mgnify:CR=1 FL=1
MFVCSVASWPLFAIITILVMYVVGYDFYLMKDIVVAHVTKLATVEPVDAAGEVAEGVGRFLRG